MTSRPGAEGERQGESIVPPPGTSVSAVLKRGVLALREGLAADAVTKPSAIYSTLDLGKGGYAKSPARRAKRDVGQIIRRKHRR